MRAMQLISAPTAGDDIIRGFSSDDGLAGGAGNDMLTGLAGNDTFWMDGHFGSDTVTDLHGGAGLSDMIRLSLGPAFDSFAEVMA